MLEKLFPYEQWGFFTIHRYDRVIIYKFLGIPIWATFYTLHYNEINISLIFSQLKKRLFGR